MGYGFSAMGIDRQRNLRPVAGVSGWCLVWTRNGAGGEGDGVSVKVKLIVGLVIVLAALFWNRNYITYRVEVTDPICATDNPSLMIGYQRVHNFADTLKWWHGNWIHSSPDAQGYRPLSSYFHYAEISFLLKHGWNATGWITFALFATCCLLVAGLAWRLTKSLSLATVAGLLAASINGSNSATLLWYPIGSDYIVYSLMFGAMILFATWLEQPRLRYIVGVWALMVLGCFTKEYAYCLPLMLAALGLLPSQPSRRRLYAHVGAMAGVSAAFYVYRGLVVPHPRNPPVGRLEALSNVLRTWLPPSPSDMFIMDGGRLSVAILHYVGIGACAWLLWRHRSAVAAYMRREDVRTAIAPAAVAWMLWQLSYLPILGFPASGHYLIPGAIFKSLFVAVAAQGAYSLISLRSVAAPFTSTRIAPLSRHLRAQHSRH